MNGVFSGTVAGVRAHSQGVNSRIPDAFDLVRPGSGLALACQTFMKTTASLQGVVPYSGDSSWVCLESSSQEALQHLKLWHGTSVVASTSQRCRFDLLLASLQAWSCSWRGPLAVFFLV